MITLRVYSHQIATEISNGIEKAKISCTRCVTGRFRWLAKQITQVGKNNIAYPRVKNARDAKSPATSAADLLSLFCNARSVAVQNSMKGISVIAVWLKRK